MIFFFFFSSRRRHTRCYRDWSSDVCSSDLGLGVRALLAAGAYTQAMRAGDRFGDSGLTGLLIAIPEGGGLRVDTWLMSCRVLGRRLEETMFAALVRYAAEHGYTRITGEYISTDKNRQVADLYISLGCAAAGEEGGSRFFLWETGRVFAAP